MKQKLDLKAFLNAVCIVLSGLMFALPVHATYVGEVQTTKFLDPTTVNMIATRLQSGNPGIQVGDEISYFIQFTPTNNGGMVGAGGYVTDYIPAGTQVANAQFVQLNPDGSYTQIAPPTPAAVMRSYVPIYSETGIFYSTDPRTSKYTNPVSTNLTAANGYALGAATGCVAASLPSTTHNAWDKAMMTAYEAAAMGRAGTAPDVLCPTLATPTLALGGSPVTGPDTLVKNDSTGGQGPWRRISYPGSMMGTLVGTPLTVGTGALTDHACVGGAPTSAGAPFPLPTNTNAVRFAAGRVTVGELFTVRITLKVTDPVGVTGIINNSEVFGGDASLDPGSVSGRHVPWRYHCPAVANADTTLTVIKTVVGMCTGVGCVIQPFSGGAIPSIANVKLRYRITYLNSSGGVNTGVVLSDILPAGGTLVTSANTLTPPANNASPLVLTGPNILPVAPAAPAAGGTFNFQAIPTLGSGGGGSVEFDVNLAAAPANNASIKNTAKLVSLNVPAGVQSVATVTATTTANLSSSKTTSTANVSPGGTATYTISIANNGAAAATTVSVTDYLPSTGAAGTSNLERFSYAPPPVGTLCGATAMVAGQACGSFTSAAGVVTPVVLAVASGTVAAVAPYIGQNREVVTFTMPAAPAFTAGSNLDITFNATVGSNIASSAMPYTNDVVTKYGGGFATAPALSSSVVTGVAPVTVSSALGLSMNIDCVYIGGVCTPGSYTGGTIPTLSKVRYRLNYSNTGAQQTNVTLENTLPAGITSVTGVTGATDNPPVGQNVTFDLADIAAGTPASPTTGVMYFDLTLTAANGSGTYITNSAIMKSAESPGGVSVSRTTSVLDTADLSITKTTTTPNIAANGVATYKLFVTNNGTQPATAIVVSDELPFTGTVANAALRFNYVTTPTAGAMAPNITCSNPSTGCPTMAASQVAPPTMVGYTLNTNQQEAKWTMTGSLAAGQTMTITYTAQAGASIPSGSTVYTSDAVVKYNSGATVLYAADLGTAPVTIPTGLSVSTSIDCIYNAAGTVCDAYTGTGIIPLNAKLRYKMHYQNTGAAKTNVYLCNQLTSTQAAPVFAATITTPVVVPRNPAGAATNTAAPNGPPVGAVTNPAVAACGFTATGVRFNFPVIPNLAAGAFGDVYFDAVTNVAVSSALTSTGKITVSPAPATAPIASETSAVTAFVQDGPVLTITKSTTTPQRKVGETAAYTINITNTGNLATTSINVMDFLPFSGTAADATKRFAWLSNGTITCPAATPTCPAALPAPGFTFPPTPGNTPFDANTNQQQVSWNFPTLALQPGATMSFSFNAIVGSAMPADDYFNNVKADLTYLAGATTKTASYGTALGEASDTVTVAQRFPDIVVSLGNGVTVLTSGGTTTYTFTVTNNGPDAADGTQISVPAATGLTKTGVSCSGSGCPSYLFTSNAIADLENGSYTINSLPSGQSVTVTVTATVDALPGTTVNTIAAAIMPTGVADGTPATPLVVMDTDNVDLPDLTTSSKAWVDDNGGTQEPGDVITYTITVTESNGLDATNVNVTDPIPANTTLVAGSIVIPSAPAGATNHSTTTFIDIRNVTVPANSSVQVKFKVLIAAGTAVGTAINNTATVNVGPSAGATPSAAPITVGTPPTAGMKALYLYGADAATGLAACAAATPCKMSRVQTPAAAPSNSLISISRGSAFTWNLAPALKLPVTLDPALLPAVVAPALPGIPVTLYLTNGDTKARTFNLQVELYCSSTAPVAPAVAPISRLLTTPSLPVAGLPLAVNFTLPLAAITTCSPPATWVLRLTNSGKVSTTRLVNVNPVVGAAFSTVSLPSQNVISVDSFAAYSVPFTNAPNTTTKAEYAGGETVYLRAVVSDPFGSFDISSAKVAVSTPTGVLKNLLTGTVAVTAASPAVAGTNTLFTTELVVGDVVTINNAHYTVSAIASNTSLTLASAVAASGTGLSVNKPANMPMVLDSGLASKTFELAYTIPVGAAAGSWNAAVIGVEGVEGTVKHSRNGSFTVGSAVHHFAINTNGASGSTCAAKKITITAQDASNATVTGYTGTINISTSSGHGDWAKTAIATDAEGVLTAGANDSGSASYAFALADNGMIDLNLSDQHQEDLTVTVVDSVSGTSLTTSASIAFSANSFVITPDPIQVAGKPQSMTVEMMRKDPSTGVCGVASNYTGAKNLKAWLTRDGDDPAGTAPTIGVLNLPDSVPFFSNNLALTFASGSASFTLGSSDVGKYVLNLRDDSGTFAGSVATPIQIDGSSTTITTRPFAVVVSDIKQGTTLNPASTTAAGAKFAKAGTSFQATVGGYLWNTAADADSNGVPDVVATLAQITANGAAPSYKWPVTLSPGIPYTPATAADTPVGTGAAGTLNNGAVVAADFSNGIAAPATLNYTEVGSFTLSGVSSNFLNTSGVSLNAIVFDNAATPARNGVVGRFYPDHFTLTETNGVMGSACGGFTYAGQAMTYSTRPSLKIEAMNALGDLPVNVTKNYVGAYQKLAAGNVTITAPTADGTQNGKDAATKTALTASMTAGALTNTNGTMTYTLAAGDTYTYTRNANAQIAPYTSDIQLAVASVTDSDGTAASVLKTLKPSGSPVRYGQLSLSNAYGSELLDLAMPFETQYWNGSGWIKNADDACTSGVGVSLSDPNTLDGLVVSDVCVWDTGSPGSSGKGCAAVATVKKFASPPVAGGFNLNLKAPGNSKSGSLDVSATGMPAWLPSSGSKRATFGIYIGKQPFIYLRESY